MNIMCLLKIEKEREREVEWNDRETSRENNYTKLRIWVDLFRYCSNLQTVFHKFISSLKRKRKERK